MQRSKPDRAIDEVLAGNADKARVRRAHGYYTTALNGLLRAAQEAYELGDTIGAHGVTAEARRLDVDWAIRLSSLAARDT